MKAHSALAKYQENVSRTTVSDHGSAKHTDSSYGPSDIMDMRHLSTSEPFIPSKALPVDLIDGSFR
jgi:hypothetical protein